MRRTIFVFVSLGYTACVPFGALPADAPALSAVTYPAGIYPRDIALGDLNGDNFPDVVTANDDSDDVSVFFNDGAGGLSIAHSFATTENPLSVDVNDIDQDGDLDVIVGTFHIQSPSQISLLLNDGTGELAAPYTLAYENPLMEGFSVRVFDLNNDGRGDIISQSISETSIFLNLGNGIFGTEQTYSDQFFQYDFVVGDLDLDGAPDLLTGGFAAHDIGQDNGFHLRSYQSGALQSTALLTNQEVPNAMALGDLNNDGLLDIATSFETANKIEALLNTGGSFVSSEKQRTGDNPLGLTLADLNGDGSLDIITADYDSQDVGLLLNDGEAHFSRVAQYSIGASPMHLAATDLNGDGASDIVTVNPADNSVTVLLNGSTNQPK